ncbi:hypothetical protein MHY85_07425 [Cellulomonas sp. ACRRI]|uniref:hypothetical protein n=1 Tax=Cellulomonas sp. ACRRI TaxID=2918188 RepID=UPI001EF1F4B0|nr:hypothetical protein [Cellulomonas sp. ACRRI]MCG7285802.1 hypothetical protein [Cellulomonas sp. ACRRI]
MSTYLAPDAGPAAAVQLCWIPLGAGGPRVVRASGRAYEALAALHDRRPPRALVHAALLLRPSDGDEVAVEVTPAWGPPAVDRGVVATGPVGTRLLGRSRLFRYEVRCWAGGSVPDLAWAVVRLPASADPRVADALLAAAPSVPVRTWGARGPRGPARVGRAPAGRDMWTSNSVAAWLLAAAGLDPTPLGPPAGCRAPGWDAGLRAAGATSPDRDGGGAVRTPGRARSPRAAARPGTRCP